VGGLSDRAGLACRPQAPCDGDFQVSVALLARPLEVAWTLHWFACVEVCVPFTAIHMRCMQVVSDGSGHPCPQPLSAMYTPGAVEHVGGAGDIATELGSLLSPIGTHDNIIQLLGVRVSSRAGGGSGRWWLCVSCVLLESGRAVFGAVDAYGHDFPHRDTRQHHPAARGACAAAGLVGDWALAPGLCLLCEVGVYARGKWELAKGGEGVWG
jgi:hypothetical protein